MHVNKALLLGGKAPPSRVSAITLAFLGAALAAQITLAPVPAGFLDTVFDLFQPHTDVPDESPVGAGGSVMTRAVAIAVTQGGDAHSEDGVSVEPTLPNDPASPTSSSPVLPVPVDARHGLPVVANNVVQDIPAPRAVEKPAIPAKPVAKPSPLPAKTQLPKPLPVAQKLPLPSKPSVAPQGVLPPSCSMPFSSGRALSVTALGVRSLTPGVLVYASADVSCRLVPGAVLSGGERIIRVDADRLRVETDKRVIQLIDD